MAAEAPGSPRPADSDRSPRRFFVSWLLLLALAGLNLGLAQIPLGPWQTPVALAIAALMAVLLLSVYMHLGRPGALLRLTACVGFLWLWFMWILMLADYLTRNPPVVS